MEVGKLKDQQPNMDVRLTSLFLKGHIGLLDVSKFVSPHLGESLKAFNVKPRQVYRLIKENLKDPSLSIILFYGQLNK